MFSNLNYNCSNLLDLRNLQNFENSRPSALNFKSFSQIIKTIFFLTVGQNNFGNKMPFLDLDIASLLRFVKTGTNDKNFNSFFVAH